MWEEGRALTSQLRGPERCCGPGAGARATRAGPLPESLPPVSQATQPSLGVGVWPWGGGQWGWECGPGGSWAVERGEEALWAQPASPFLSQSPSNPTPAHCATEAWARLRALVSSSGSGGGEDQVQASLLVTDDLTPASHLHSLRSHLPEFWNQSCLQPPFKLVIPCPPPLWTAFSKAAPSIPWGAECRPGRRMGFGV